MRTEPSATRRRLPRPHSGGGPQHLLITILGDYWFARGEHLPSAAIVDLLAEFGSNENASRQAIRRLTQRGLLSQQRTGRTTFYGIPSDVVSKQRLGLTRTMTFGQDYTDWDGRWTVVTFSVPEAQRETRRHLRNGLKALGFGDLHDGVWITPRDQRLEATELVTDLDIDNAQIMRSVWSFRDEDGDAIRRAFKLDALLKQYQSFISEYEPQLTTSITDLNARDALLTRTKLSSDWLAFRIIDPELPAELLPDDWPRRHARRVFLGLYDRLGPLAAGRVREIIEAYDASLATIVTHQQAPAIDDPPSVGLVGHA